MAALEGRKALVTGGTRGIGRAIVSRLLADGAEVHTTGRGREADVPAGAAYRGVDFADRKGTEAFAEEVRGQGFDVLVNSAGINRVSPFAEISLEDFDEVLEVNLRAPFLLCRAVLPSMVNARWGRIVNVGSIFGKISKEGRAPYSASKFGLDGLTAALSAEAAEHGVLANSVAPGFIDTDLTRQVLGEAGIAALVGGVPVRRLGTPEEIASVVAWLVSPENTFVTGQNIAADGGFTRV